ncbi:hypothetical protein N4G70_31945 [Streptomyces sp. ASQP_92]|uniref:hypothetical protein n=1 Tax=Streptomyces sp. ASQP_92 TaxID=2979116 RepID=UPI0021C1C65F|nr:hypothetical protein [Streptomyces sp. ASQP_92]MCT9093447.1 hypothetical protein [Streptomyces sp. ASQP_92]
MRLLTASELTALAGQVATQLGSQCHVLPDDRQDDAVRIVDDEGRALILYQEEAKPERLFLTACLPEAATAQGFALRPVTVAASSAAAHVAAHIRRRLLPALAQVLADYEKRPTPQAPTATTESASDPAPALADVLDAFASPYIPGRCDGWVIGELVSRRRSLPAVWWQTLAAPDDNCRLGTDGRGMVPFLGDALRRAGFHTTEPRHGRCVYVAPPRPELPHPRYTLRTSAGRSGSWDVVDRYTGAAIRSSSDLERAGYFAEQLESEHGVQRESRVASLELPGIQTGAAESTLLRVVAVLLARQGFIPYGLDCVDHADVPGFLALASPVRPGQVEVHRVLEPWGSGRPAPGGGALGAGHRFDRDLASYARCLTASGFQAVVDRDRVRAEFTVGPTLLGGPGDARAGEEAAARLPVWIRPTEWSQ